ncbi:UNC-like C-terminal-domain-containing protein [Gilbertella persicaria]|uniref:UNC-like C-terminal-domain-containing protein n=1 Tax=Gilbertella persicaria TaxID=101096 RepID=UPI0022203AB7|nr:UNC-like C-terminal-domain-containing protein [Gilbertella persicaria]KAI8074255.1 UNC-like C-terminal-domain-containing protein [Gilbertella persicaria]
MAQNPAVERRQRMLASQYNQNVPGTPNRTLLSSPSGSGYDFDDSLKKSEYHTNDTIQAQQDWWRIVISNFLESLIKPIVFVLFMLFWIIKEPVIRFITFLTMIVSALIVEPAVYFSSHLPNYQQWIPTLETRNKIAHMFAVTLVTCSSLYLAQQTLDTHTPFHWIEQQLSTFNLPSFEHNEYTAGVDLSLIHKRLASMDQKIAEQSKVVHQFVDQLGQQVAAEHAKIWSALETHQSQIDTLYQKLDQQVRDAIESQLPEMLLVHTNEQGKLELSPQFYLYLQNISFWDVFLEQNKAAISRYMQGEMKHYLDQQRKEGAVISKEAFMKLVASDLTRYDGDALTLHELVEQAIHKYHQDVLNTPDFALKSRGAHILHSKTSYTYDPVPAWIQNIRRSVGLTVWHHVPELAIQPDIHVGQCWSMVGQQGTLGIVLSRTIHIQSITVEHPSMDVLVNEIDSAPQEMEFYGIHQHPEEYTLLGKAYYDIHKNTTIQTFDMLMTQEPFHAILVKIKSNWGNHDHTDIYRIRVHGTPLSV